MWVVSNIREARAAGFGDQNGQLPGGGEGAQSNHVCSGSRRMSNDFPGKASSGCCWWVVAGEVKPFFFKVLFIYSCETQRAEAQTQA